MGFIKTSLEEVKITSILNSFKKAGFDIEINEINNEIENEESVFNEVWSKLTQLTHISYDSFDEYINVDRNLPTYSTLTDDEIITFVKSDLQESLGKVVEEQNDQNQQIKNISSAEAFDCLNKLQIFFSSKNNEVGYDLILKAQQQLSKNILTNLKQTKIIDFLN